MSRRLGKKATTERRFASAAALFQRLFHRASASQRGAAEQDGSSFRSTTGRDGSSFRSAPPEPGAPEAERRGVLSEALSELDAVRGRMGGVSGRPDVAIRRLGHHLEALGDLAAAADAFALGGAPDDELRVLEAAGDLDRLERRLNERSWADRARSEAESALRDATDLDAVGERRSALRRLAAWSPPSGSLGTAPLIERKLDPSSAPWAVPEAAMVELGARIRARMARPPIVWLKVEGRTNAYVFGDEVVVGRSKGALIVGSPSVSRRHLRIARSERGVIVEDLATRNGTRLGDGTLSGQVVVETTVDPNTGRASAPLELALGGDVPCRVGLHLLGSASAPSASPSDSSDAPVRQGRAEARADVACCTIELGGRLYVAPLGALHVGRWRIEPGEDSLVLVAPEGSPQPVLAGLLAARRIELCLGDRVAVELGGDPIVEVVARSEDDASSFRP